MWFCSVISFFFFGSLWARRCAVCVADVMKCDSTLLSKSPYLLPLLLEFFSPLHHFPPLLIWCHELTILLNVFTVFNDWLRQYWQDPILWKFAGWFPYLWKLWNISSFLPPYVENIWWRKDQNAWHLRARVLKLDPPPTNRHVKAEACTGKTATVQHAPVTHIKYVDTWLLKIWHFEHEVLICRIYLVFLLEEKIFQLSPFCISV